MSHRIHRQVALPRPRRPWALPQWHPHSKIHGGSSQPIQLHGSMVHESSKISDLCFFSPAKLDTFSVDWSNLIKSPYILLIKSQLQVCSKHPRYKGCNLRKSKSKTTHLPPLLPSFIKNSGFPTSNGLFVPPPWKNLPFVMGIAPVSSWRLRFVQLGPRHSPLEVARGL